MDWASLIGRIGAGHVVRVGAGIAVLYAGHEAWRYVAHVMTTVQAGLGG